jgi:hypothetical protein
MEQTYSLDREDASLKMARAAARSKARLVHYDLAGRYSLKALSAESLGRSLAEILPPPIMANRRRATLRCNYSG